MTGKWRRILMIDDSELDMQLMRSRMERENVVFLRAPDCATGIRTALLNLPLNLIMLDIRMHPDGWECSRLIRAEPRLKHIPLVALTGTKVPGDEIRAREAGFVDYLEKPMFSPDLVPKLLSYLK